MIGFDRSAWLRVSVAALFCTAAVALCLAVEGLAAPQLATTPADRAAVVTRHLSIESTYPVATWRVQVLGAVQQATASDARTWRGVVSLPPDEEVLVVGVAAASAAPGGRALRVVLAGAAERVVWGEGDLALTVSP